MKLFAVLALVCGLSAQAKTLVCPSTSEKGSTLRLQITRGRMPQKLSGDHRYNNHSSFVALDCDKTSKIVASIVKYHCADGTYGVDYADISFSPLAFQGSGRFPVKVTYLDENTNEPFGAGEVFQCGK